MFEKTASGKVVSTTPCLKRKVNETDEKFFNRMEKLGYLNLKQVKASWSQDNQVYSTILPAEDKPQAERPKTDKSNEENRIFNTGKIFIHNSVSKLGDIPLLYKKCPMGRLPVFFFSYFGKGEHMTICYVPCNCDYAIALYAFAQKFVEKYPILDVEPEKKSDINSYLYPNMEIFEVKTKLNKSIIKILSTIGNREWQAHITFRGKVRLLKDLKPSISITYAAIDTYDKTFKSAQTYLSNLKIKDYAFNSEVKAINTTVEPIKLANDGETSTTKVADEKVMSPTKSEEDELEKADVIEEQSEHTISHTDAMKIVSEKESEEQKK